ncbi:hypothetical protein [Bradyrhizobium sp. CCBAU 11434]|uniref:hypothetical protein n=1 Tax=Bradyrhizobium sp. CCBAU 11434 TaxID=1630885 RepID=UPI0023067FD4|nr:hypothetical protein [Bradyrhizobium sp. CCBAU 11434]
MTVSLIDAQNLRGMNTALKRAMLEIGALLKGLSTIVMSLQHGGCRSVQSR